MYTKSIWVPIVIGLSVISGCNSSGNGKAESTTVSEAKPLVEQKNVYASTSIANGNILFGGENGLSIVNTLDSESSQKMANSFSLPTFESSNEVFRKTDGVVYSKSDEGNNTEAEKSRIYSMLNVDDGILVGGSFASVNGVEKHNLVKLNLDGTVNTEFKSDVGGTVNKILKLEDSLLIAGTIGSYNNKEAYALVEINANGKRNEQFLPFQDYMFAKINDMIQLSDENIMLAGTFIKDALEEDQNKSQEELIELLKTIIIINKEGFVNEELTAKFSDLKNEVFALAIDKGKVYVAGDFHLTKNNKVYNHLVSYDLNGGFDENFQIEKLLGMIFDVAIYDNKVLFAGDFLIDADDDTRSFYLVDKAGKTIKIENMNIDADIYNIDIYNGDIIMSGEGEFKVSDKKFKNGLVLKLDNI
ncbi:MAG: Unknown protein [uncultured Sulfurovum sp.]|uniref:Uncharacterized protein n=1 Tax=uncultured Sulfurovum sp. TaxID=269237 RepID=A0A6S6U0K7_9BACT|nr:MAG: Unknown protein [uncultured Sulfurovum sp.]